MLRVRGFTLLEMMIVVVVIALLAAVGYPSYREHVARGQRSQGQQVLSDIAQRQEQFMLDRRQYADTFGAGATGLGLTLPTGIKYGAPDFSGVNNAATPPFFVICMAPTAGSPLAARGDGTLCINSRGERWREPNGSNKTFESASGSGDCAWENRSCKITGEN